jgi:hypothetical protein
MITAGARCTREIKYGVAMANAAFSKKQSVYTSRLELN